jgi:DNA-binding MarR family transcriptional regulator
MERAGYVDRQPHEKDRRAHRIKLAPKGKKAYEAARAIAVALQGDALSVLPEANREQFLEQLALVADACREASGQR